MLTNKDILTPPIFLSYSLGCRTNQAEIENISLQLSAYGFTPYSPPCTSAPLHLCTYPTIVMLNTCVVTQKAERETRKETRKLRRLYPKAFLVVLGCAVTAKEKYKIDLPKADLLIPNEEKSQTINLILKQINTKLSDSMGVCYNPSVNKYQLSGRKFIKIQDGCNKFCSFCITCLIRGKPISFPPQKIIEEINFWVDKGIKEIVLTGINIGLYGSVIASEAWQSQPSYTKTMRLLRRYTPRNDITYLLNKILSEAKVERLSFSSIYPEMLTGDFLKTVVGNPRITQYLHLSLQSGSETVLERMNRETDLKDLLRKLKLIKRKNPLFTFRADIITGFPNETEKEFEDTIDFIKKAKISFVHSFLFSLRPGTKAEGMIKSGKWQEVASTVKKQRAKILGKVVEKIRNDEAKLMTDSLFHCLIVREFHHHSRLDRESIKNNLIDSRSRPLGLSGMTIWEGITENGWPILVQSSKLKVKSFKGKILPVKIVNFDENYLLGKIVSLPT